MSSSPAPAAAAPGAAPCAPAARVAAVPGLDRVASHAGAARVPAVDKGAALSARGNPAARDLIRHATMRPGRQRAAARARGARRCAAGRATSRSCSTPTGCIDVPVLLLWADDDPAHPLAIAEEALDLLPDAMLRVLPGTGFLMAYDDPVGLARELAAFCP